MTYIKILFSDIEMQVSNDETVVVTAACVVISVISGSGVSRCVVVVTSRSGSIVWLLARNKKDRREVDD